MPFDLFDPFGLSAKASPEKKEKGLLAEINNGARAHPPVRVGGGWGSGWLGLGVVRALSPSVPEAGGCPPSLLPTVVTAGRHGLGAVVGGRGRSWAAAAVVVLAVVLAA